jgi:hypothetical protein
MLPFPLVLRTSLACIHFTTSKYKRRVSSLSYIYAMCLSVILIIIFFMWGKAFPLATKPKATPSSSPLPPSTGALPP